MRRRRRIGQGGGGRRDSVRPVRCATVRPAVDGGCSGAEAGRLKAGRAEHRTAHTVVIALIFTTLGSSIAKPNLNGRLAELDASGQIFAYVRVRILRQLEDLL